MSIISVTGRIGHGKDTVGRIIQLIMDHPHFTDKAIEEWLERDCLNPSWEIKKWADKLKEIVCLLIGCTREQLEDQKFKETELPESWWYYSVPSSFTHVLLPRGYYPNEKDNEICEARYLVKPTPRLLLQQLGTECGRNIIHPNIWVNSLMSEYKALVNHCNCTATTYEGCSECLEYPNWIITDTRFPNELRAVKERGGLSIKVERYPDFRIYRNGNVDDFELVKFDPSNPIHVQHWKGECQLQHESETALDNAEFDETIINDGSILDLIVKVRKVLTKRGVI